MTLRPTASAALATRRWPLAAALFAATVAVALLRAHQVWRLGPLEFSSPLSPGIAAIVLGAAACVAAVTPESEGLAPRTRRLVAWLGAQLLFVAIVGGGVVSAAVHATGGDVAASLLAWSALLGVGLIAIALRGFVFATASVFAAVLAVLIAFARAGAVDPLPTFLGMATGPMGIAVCLVVGVAGITVYMTDPRSALGYRDAR